MITVLVEGPTDQRVLETLLVKEMGNKAKAIRVVSLGGDKAFRGSLAQAVKDAVESPADVVFALIDLFAHPFDSDPGESRDDAVSKVKQCMTDFVPTELRGQFRAHVVCWELEALYLTHPELLAKQFSLPAAHEMYEKPEDVNGRAGVHSRMDQLARATPGARTPGKEALARLLAPKLSIEPILSKCPHFAAFWNDLKERAAA